MLLDTVVAAAVKVDDNCIPLAPFAVEFLILLILFLSIVTPEVAPVTLIPLVVLVPAVVIPEIVLAEIRILALVAPEVILIPVGAKAPVFVTDNVEMLLDETVVLTVPVANQIAASFSPVAASKLPMLLFETVAPSTP
jgi:hypothetical protein